MPIKEVCSPISRKGSKVASGQPLSPGAKSNPSRGDQTEAPNIPPQPSQARVSLGNKEEPASVEIIGPGE
jgi:hypothetical protein